MRRSRFSTYSFAWLLSGAALTLAGAPALAQSAPDDVTEEVDSGDAIVVTARKRAETLLDVPIAVSAFNGASIQDKMAQDITDLADFTPGFQIQEAFGRDGDRPVMRGASNILFSEGKVGIFLDGAPYLGDFSSLDLANIERVEVIKGPQSAVFGRGTLSGAINVVLKRPTDEFEGRVSGTIGNFDRRELSAALSGPIIDGIGFQAGVKFFDIDGQWRNTAVPGERLGDQNTRQYTAGLFFDPTADISASVRWLHQEDDDSHFAIGLQRSSANNCFLTTRPYYCGVVQPMDSFGINTDRLVRPGLYRNADRFIGDISWDIAGSGYEASLQAGYSDLTEVNGVDQTYDDRGFYFLPQASCGRPPFFALPNQDCRKSSFEATTGIRRKTQTYEGRLTSPGDDRFRWRLGAFYSEDKQRGMTEYLELNEVGPELLDDTKRVKNTAFFGGIDFDVSSTVTIGAELRHQIDKVYSDTPSYRVGDVFDAAYLATVTRPNPNQIVGVEGTRKATFKATLPRITVNWKPQNDLSFYAQYSQGNSPGGFNKASAPDPTYDEEELINYEIGMKTSKFGFDYLNFAAFWQDYKNQVLTNTYIAGNIVDSYSVNIGRTRIRGIEIDGQLPLVGDILKLQFNYSFLDAEIREGVEAEKALQLMGRSCKTGTAVNLDLPGCREAASIAGNRPPLVSKHTGTLGVRFQHDVGNDWTFFAGSDVIYRSSYYAQVLNLAESGNSTKLNLQFGVHDDQGMRVTVYGKNVLGDETPIGILRYLDFPAPRTPTGDYARAFGITPARKAEFGITVSKSF
ncbi:TonB-dependent receptor [Sphingomonas cavernae]|uniref:TonB-dependent receptor n=1 Tax=Sphingomonas cavernae TaxID=2320861 RepID=A0A418WRF8_9SPHN|nr:TonB-dependent receptor [Sphingomonas cavernae]RJF93807.1 TonB-dependent receptor [Sphingomonas cavernae]